MATHTLAARAAAEMLGSLMTYCLAVGGVANALLPRTKGEGMGLLAIAIAAGMGIGLPIAMFYRVSWHRRRRCLLRLHRRSNPVSHAVHTISLANVLPPEDVLQARPVQVSAFFNPGILLAQAVRGNVGGAGDFFALLAAELVGYFAGAVVLCVFYLPHLNSAVQLPAADEVDRLLLDPSMLRQAPPAGTRCRCGYADCAAAHKLPTRTRLVCVPCLIAHSCPPPPFCLAAATPCLPTPVTTCAPLPSPPSAPSCALLRAT